MSADDKKEYLYKTTKDAVGHLGKLMKTDKYKNYLSDNDQLQELVTETIDIWDNCKETVDNWDVLTKYFNCFKNDLQEYYNRSHTYHNFDFVMYPFLILNSIYETKLSFKQINALTLYVSHPNNLKRIFEGVKNQNKTNLERSSIIDDINLNYSHLNNVTSFLSKLFCILNSNAYAMKDKFATKTINHLIENIPDLKDKLKKLQNDSSYNSYITTIDKLGITFYDYRTLDKFLWLFGKTLPQDKKTKKK